MLKLLGHRALQSAFVVAAVTLALFAGLHIAGNPVDVLISPEADPADRARAIAALGLDQPLWRQYLLFLNGALHGDLGRSFVYNEPALRLILQRLPATLELAGAAVLISLLAGVPLGLLAALRPESAASRAVVSGSILGFSLPTFWVGLMLILLFSVRLGWLPSGGRGATAMLFGVPWSFLTVDGLRHMALPVLNLTLFNAALMLRLSYAGAREILPTEFVQFARAQGLSPSRIVLVHVAKNLLAPVVTIAGLELGTTIAFSVVTETIFAWPGTGKLIIESIYALDRPVIVAYLIIIVLLVVFINLVVDLLYAVFDPRVRLAE